MNAMIQKFVDSGLFNETVGNAIEEAINNGESIIIAGHRSTGSRPLMVNLMAVVKKQYNAVQVKSAADLEKEADYYLIPSLPNEDMEALIEAVIKKPNASFVTIKDPEEQAISMFKILKKANKTDGPINKKFFQMDLDKTVHSADGIPMTKSVLSFNIDEKGKIVKEPLEF